ncbi:MAG: hypothetical protein E7360_04090 [Clostridiales bacterium]|nr:hypothetical protein [Clostridiales bacterium]
MITNKIKLRQVCLTFIAFTLAIKIIILPSLTASFADQSLWISAFINFSIDGATLFFILKMTDKFKGLSFYQILRENVGETLTKIIMFLYCVYFILKAYVPIMEQKSFIEISLYETTHVVFIFLPIFLIACFFSYKGIKTVGRLADLSVWFTLFAVTVLIALSSPIADFSNLLPLFKVPFSKVTAGSYNTQLWYFDSTYMLFFMGAFKEERLKKTKILLSYGAVAVITIIFFAVLYGEFGPLTPRQYFAPIKMGKYYLSLSNSGRIDYFAGFALAIVCVFAVTLPLVFATLCLSHTFNFKHKIIPCIIVNGFSAILFFFTQDFFYETFKLVQKYALFFMLFVAYTLPLCMLFFKKGRSKS